MLLPSTLFNPVYFPYLRCAARTQIFFGGSSSGKSSFLAQRCVLDVLSGRNVLIVRKVGRTLRGSCWNEVQKAIRLFRAENRFHVSLSDMTVTCRANGRQILFAGLDDVEKIKSLTPARGALTDIWMEEATECLYSDMKQLEKRMRGRSRFEKRLTLSFNPIDKAHWLYREFFSAWQDGPAGFPPPAVYGESVPGRSVFQSGLVILKTTYRDNRFLTEDDVSALENEPDPYYHRVYTRGDWGVRGGAVFRDWAVKDLKALSSRFPDKRFGLDFGFSRDPSACVCCALSRAERTIYVFRELYAAGLTCRDLACRLGPFLNGRPVVCDSAEPRSIAELRALGVSALPARKGPDSVLHGLWWLQGYRLVVDRDCRNMIRELTQYRWKEGPGRPCAEGEDHLIDALRYALEDEQLSRRAAFIAKGGVLA